MVFHGHTIYFYFDFSNTVSFKHIMRQSGKLDNRLFRIVSVLGVVIVPWQFFLKVFLFLRTQTDISADKVIP